jgi:hypothetical protein
MATTTIDFQSEARSIDLPGSGSSAQGNFGNFLSGAMSAVMAIAAILALMYLIWGGVEWITSAGDKSKLEAARNKIQNALLGLIVLAATTALFMLIQQFLEICVLRIGGSC